MIFGPRWPMNQLKKTQTLPNLRLNISSDLHRHQSFSLSHFSLFAHRSSAIFSGKHLKMLLDSPVMSNVSNAVSGMMVSGGGGGGSGTFGGYGSGGGGIGIGGGGGGTTHYNVSLR